MKVTLFFLLLAVVASQTAVVNGPSPRANFQAGYTQSGDRMLNRSYLQKYPIFNAIQYQDFTYRGNATTRISLVRATEVGGTQYGSAWILNGGVGWNYVTLRVQSARGWGYYYMVEVWGR